ncbi:MAG: thioredoxin [Bacillota bacterium]|jgi:thioredoxin 1
MIKNISNVKEFNEILAKAKSKVIVDFYADWCGPCKMQAPVLEEFSKKKPDAVILKVNVDQNVDLAEAHAIMSIPTMMVFVNGKQTYKKPGFHALNLLENLLNN